jgi:hypothetical protein
LQSALFQFVARESEVPEVFQKQAVLHITELRGLFDDAAPYLIARSPIFLCTRLLRFWLEYQTPIAALIGTVFRQKPDVTKRIPHRFDLTSFIPINRSNRHKFDLKSMASRQQEILSLKSESIVRFVQIWEQFVPSQSEAALAV